jgi:3-oxoacyl-[acyl-carrier protein] reductase
LTEQSSIVADDGGLDVLVCSHGILTQSEAADMPAATWQDTIDVDLTAVFLLTGQRCGDARTAQDG